MDIVLGSFLFYVSFMQFIEYLLWKHQKCDNYNKIVSIIGMILNHMQPIILGIIIILIAKPKIENIYIIISVMCIYFLCAILYSIEFLRNNGQCTIKNRKTKHLDWKWNGVIFIIVCFIVYLWYAYVYTRYYFCIFKCVFICYNNIYLLSCTHWFYVVFL